MTATVAEGAIATGFSLIEMLIVVALLGISYALAAPQLSLFMSGSQISAQSGDLLAAIGIARSEAIKRSTTVAIAFSPRTIESVADLGGAYTVFVDVNANGVLDSGEEILRRHESLPSRLTLLNMEGANMLGFSGRGNNSADTARSFSLCDRLLSGENGRQIVVSAAGRTRAGDFACS